nr:MAG TPA: hypothetical protein [Caudoviricetes sp.]
MPAAVGEIPQRGGFYLRPPRIHRAAQCAQRRCKSDGRGS